MPRARARAVFAVLGFLSPANRGGLMTAMLLLFVFMGVPAGYSSAYLHKTLKGVEWKKNIVLTSCLFPGVVFLLFFILNFFVWGCAPTRTAPLHAARRRARLHAPPRSVRAAHTHRRTPIQAHRPPRREKSSGAVPFGTMFALLVLWFGISVPLVFLGSYFGYRRKNVDFPVRVNQIPRQVPEQVWYMQPAFSIIVGGVLPFGAVFIELFFILSSIWLHRAPPRRPDASHRPAALRPATLRPTRTAPHRTAPHRTTPHRTAHRVHRAGHLLPPSLSRAGFKPGTFATLSNARNQLARLHSRGNEISQSISNSVDFFLR